MTELAPRRASGYAELAQTPNKMAAHFRLFGVIRPAATAPQVNVEAKPPMTTPVFEIAALAYTASAGVTIDGRNKAHPMSG